MSQDATSEASEQAGELESSGLSAPGPASTEEDGSIRALGERGELLIALLVFAFAIVYLWPLRDVLSFNADEGVTLQMADRILQGQLPYRDFFTFVTPGSPYLMALWFKLFGVTYVVGRSALLIYAGIFAAITYRLGRYAGSSRGAALFAAALLIFGCMPARFFVLHNWDSTLFALLAIYCAQSFVRSPEWVKSFLLGLATALTVLTEQSKGAGLLLGLGIAALALTLPARRSLRVPLRYLWAAAAGLAIPIAITFAYFASQHAVGPMLQDWIWPLRHFNSAVNRLPYGAPPITPEALHGMYSSASWAIRGFLILFGAPMLLISLLPLLVLASTLYAAALRHRIAPSAALDAHLLGGSILLGIFLSVLSTGRADLNHLIYLTPLFVYLVPSIFDLHQREARLFLTSRRIVAGLLLIAFVGFGMVALLPAFRATTRVETRRGALRMTHHDEVLSYVEKNIPRGAHLYVHPYQALYSFLCGTVNPTRFAFLLPGMNTQEQYEDAIGELSADRTPYVLLNPGFSDFMPTTWPSAPAELLASDPVEDYILQHYRTCRVLNTEPQQVWRFYFMVRMDLPCPNPD